MIVCFPTIYPDELLYSQLARYFTKSGYMAYTFAAEELFLSKTVRPDIEFVNAYTSDAIQAITRNMPMEAMIEKHTMFPYYGRFLARERRQKAFQALAYMAQGFQSDVDLESEVTVGEYLHSRMGNIPYRSVRGEQRNITLFHADFMEFYQDLPDNWFVELWQIQKVLTSYRVNFYEICLMAFFLNITADELVHMELPEKTQQQLLMKRFTGSMNKD